MVGGGNGYKGQKPNSNWPKQIRGLIGLCLWTKFRQVCAMAKHARFITTKSEFRSLLKSLFTVGLWGYDLTSRGFTSLVWGRKSMIRIMGLSEFMHVSWVELCSQKDSLKS